MQSYQIFKIELSPQILLFAEQEKVASSNKLVSVYNLFMCLYSVYEKKKWLIGFFTFFYCIVNGSIPFSYIDCVYFILFNIFYLKL